MIPRESAWGRKGSSGNSGTAVLRFSALLLLFPFLFLTAGGLEADVYQYRDQNGNWVITDTPPDHAGDLKVIRDPDRRPARSARFRDIEKDLSTKFPPQSEIEAASLSTVTIRTSMGLGSGFFINDSGYILTNRHVVRGDESQIKKTEEFIAQTDDKAAESEAIIADGDRQLSRMRSNLEQYKAHIDRMTDPAAREAEMKNYRSRAEQYDLYESQLRKRRADFEERLTKYQQEKGEFTKRARMAKQERRFVVILKDRTEVEADLVTISRDHDLALLRVGGCKSPYLRSGAQGRLVQGMRVFAIGSPLGVGDTVSSGVVSGYDDDYIRTDAKIYLGNSGGPLITADGRVVGINTLKLITQKFEGIGFAIPVRRAFQEFSPYLKANP